MTSPLESRLRDLSLPTPAGFAARLKADSSARPLPAEATRPRGISRRRVLGAAGALAVGVAGLLLAHALWPAPQGDAGHAAAKSFLLVAAKRAAATPEGGGAYWRITVDSGVLTKVGDPANRYTIVQRLRNDTWTATSPGGQSVLTILRNGAGPWTDADRAAWQRAGSPTHWQNAKGGLIVAAPDPAETMALPDGMQQFPVTAGMQLSLDQVRRLPSDRAGLQRLLQTWSGTARTHFVPTLSRDDWTFMAIGDLLRAPVSSQVRAGLLEVLATLPRVTSLGAVKDDLGRPGQGIAYTSDPDPTLKMVIQHQLVIDPATGAVLGERDVMVKTGDPAFKYASWAKPGDEISFWVITQAGFTNATPPPLTPPLKGARG